jgi:hypothetical protein
MKKEKLLVLFCFLILCSCYNNTADNSILQINVNPQENNSVNLSEIASNSTLTHSQALPFYRLC